MYTQCPECLTVFAIDEALLELSNGMVRCGRCSTQFDALRTLTDSLPGEPFTALPAHPLSPHVPRLTDAVYCPDPDDPQYQPEPAPPAAGDASTDAPDAGADPGPIGALRVNPGEDLTAALIAGSRDAGLEFDSAEGAWLAVQPAPSGFAVEVDTAAAVFFEGPGDALLPLSGSADEQVAEDGGLPEPEMRGSSGIDAADAGAGPDALDGDAAVSGTAPEQGATGDADPSGTRDRGRWPEPAAAPDDDWFEAFARNRQLLGGDAGDAAIGDEASTGGEGGDGQPGPDGTTPVFTRRPRRRIALVDIRWIAGCAGLAILLAAQLVFADRAAVLDNPAMRPWLARMCSALPCKLPPLKDLAKLELLSRDIRPHPDVPGALMITATLRNDAAFTQPYPIVVVKLSDLDDNVVAMRRFRPAEYIQDPAERAAGIASGATVAVAFEVADPGKQAVAFHFAFQ
jgi:predicted Zn finger-like uncharacterized protein